MVRRMSSYWYNASTSVFVEATVGGSVSTSAAEQSWEAGCCDVAGLPGEVDIATCGLFAARLQVAIDADASLDEVRVDFADVRFIGVGGTRVLVTAAEALRPGRHLVVLHPPRGLTRILELAFGQVRGLRLEGARGPDRPTAGAEVEDLARTELPPSREQRGLGALAHAATGPGSLG